MVIFRYVHDCESSAFICVRVDAVIVGGGGGYVVTQGCLSLWLKCVSMEVYY